MQDRIPARAVEHFGVDLERADALVPVVAMEPIRQPVFRPVEKHGHGRQRHAFRHGFSVLGHGRFVQLHPGLRTAVDADAGNINWTHASLPTCSNGATIPALRSVPRSRPGASAPSRYGRYETGRSCAAPRIADQPAQPFGGLAAGGKRAGVVKAPLRQSEAQGQGLDAVGHRAFSFSPLSSSSAFAPNAMRAAGTVTGASTYIHGASVRPKTFTASSAATMVA